MSPCKVVVAVGLPGSGKSTYLANLGVNAISSDAIRLQLADDPADQSIHKKVFAAMRYLLRQRLDLTRPLTYIDATNLTVKDRRLWIKIARARGCEIGAIHFDIPAEICKARNAKRGRIVPESAIDQMVARLKPPTAAEGFAGIEVITVDRQDSTLA